MEVDTAIIVRLGRGSKVEVGEWNLLRPLAREVPQRLPHDGVVLDFLCALVAENQNGCRRRFHTFCLLLRKRSGSRVQILIVFLSLARPLFL